MAPKFHSTTDAFLNTQVSLAPTPVSPVADMVADMEVHVVADMKVDKVADKVVAMVANMAADNFFPTLSWTWWPTLR